MARQAEDLANDPVLVLIEDEGSDLTVEEVAGFAQGRWRYRFDANAAEILREIREHGERRVESCWTPPPESRSRADAGWAAPS